MDVRDEKLDEKLHRNNQVLLAEMKAIGLG
jgi:hypothetical protein